MSTQYTTINETELNELIQQLKAFAVIHSMPMFIACAIENNEDGTVYKTDALSPSATNRILTDNKFTDLINVMNGASTYYISEKTDQILDAIRELPEDIVDEYSEFTSSTISDEDFYGED